MKQKAAGDENSGMRERMLGMLVAMASAILRGFRSLNMTAQELVNAMMERRLRKDRGLEVRKPKSYWYTAMVNLCIELSTRSAKRPAVEDKYRRRLPTRAEPTPLMNAMRNEMLEKIQNSCSMEEWQVLRMHFLEAYSMKEIADVLAISKTTVKRRMDSGLRNARMALCGVRT